MSAVIAGPVKLGLRARTATLARIPAYVRDPGRSRRVLEGEFHAAT
jgi:hypothetical protein